MEHETHIYGAPEIIGQHQSDSGSIPIFKPAEFLEKFRKIVKEGRNSNKDFLPGENANLLDSFVHEAKVQLDSESEQLQRRLPDFMANYPYKEDYAKEFIRSARFIGVVSLRNRDKGRPELADDLFKEDNTKLVIHQLLKENRRNAYLLKDDIPYGQFGGNIWKSTRPHYYGPEDIEELKDRHPQISRALLRNIILRNRHSDKVFKVMDYAVDTLKDIRENPGNAMVTDATILFLAAETKGKQLKQKITKERKKKEIPKTEQQELLQVDDFMDTLRTDSRMKALNKKGYGQLKSMKKRYDEVKTIAEPLLEKFKKELPNMVKIEATKEHIDSFMQQADFVIKNVTTFSFLLARDKKPDLGKFFNDKEFASKVIDKTLVDLVGIFNRLTAKPTRLKLTPGSWKACRPDLYSSSEIDEFLKQNSHERIAIIREAFIKRAHNPKEYIINKFKKTDPKTIRKQIEQTMDIREIGFIGEPLLKYADYKFMDNEAQKQYFIDKATVAKKMLIDSPDKDYLSLGVRMIDISIAKNVDKPKEFLDVLLATVEQMLANPKFAQYSIQEIRNAVISSPNNPTEALYQRK